MAVIVFRRELADKLIRAAGKNPTAVVLGMLRANAEAYHEGLINRGEWHELADQLLDRLNEWDAELRPCCPCGSSSSLISAPRPG